MHTHALTHTHTQSRTHAHAHTHKHTHTHTQTHTPHSRSGELQQWSTWQHRERDWVETETLTCVTLRAQLLLWTA